MGLKESRHGTDHRMILAVLQGEGALCNSHYRRGRTCWPIELKAAGPQKKGDAYFLEIKGEVTRMMRPKNARAYWISQENWWILDRRAALQRSHWASTYEVRQEHQKCQRYLRGNRHQWVRKVGEAIEKLLASDQN